MTTLRKCLPSNVLEMICNVLGDTENGLTGGEIHRFLLQAQIVDTTKVGVMLAKRKNLFNSLVNEQNNKKCSNNILRFFEFVLSPSRYANNETEFERLRCLVNQQLAFVGYELQKNGKYKEVNVANTISEVQIKADNLKQEIEKRNGHPQIIK